MTPDDIRRLRGDRTRADFARLLGVEQLTIYRWELPLSAKESRRPRGKQLESLLAFARTEDEPGAQVAPREPPSPSKPPPSNPPPTVVERDAAMTDAEEAIVLPALALLDDARWEAAEDALISAIASGDVVSVEARALAALGMAQAKLSARLDPRGALAVLLPVLAEAEAGRLPPRAMARTYAVATMVHSTPDPLLLDLAKVNGYASRAVALLGDDEPALDLAACVRAAQIGAAGAAGDMALSASLDASVTAELDAATSPLTLAFVAAARSMAAAARGDLQAANRWTAIAVERAVALRFHAMIAMLLAGQAGNALRHAVAPETVLAVLRRAREAITDGRLIATEVRTQIPALECEAYMRMGRFEDAERAAHESMELAREAGSPPTQVSLSYARLLGYRGRAPELGPLIEKLERSNVPAAVDRAITLRSFVFNAMGDHARAIELADAIAARTSRGFVGADALVLAAMRPYGARVLGRVRDRLEETGAHARRTLERHPSVWHSALLTRFDATVLLAEGRGEEAMLRLEASLATYVLAGDVLEAAVGRLALATAATVLGHEDAAARRDACAKEYATLGLVIPPNAVWNPYEESAKKGLPTRARPSLVDRVLVAIERLAVPGLPAQLLRRELVSGLDQLLGDRRVSIGAPSYTSDGDHDRSTGGTHPADWLEIPDGAGGRLRLSFSGELSREERSAVRAVVLAAGVALENAAFRGLGEIVGDDGDGASAITDGPGFVASSPSMRRLGAELVRLSSSGSTVLLTGESGTGKDVVARRLHELSPRKPAPFVAFNCSTVPRELFEGQLFGYKRGSFTGAANDHPGVLRSADGGTVFLDEIGELPLDVQPKLLRFLENREVLGLGDARPTHVDVRVIAATHRDLARLVADGQFRADLYYRLHVVPLRIPPLRERPDDVAPLARHFLSRLADGHEPPTLGPDALAALRAHDWPGNARELRNVLERAMAFAPPPKVLRAHHLRIDRPSVPAQA